MKKFNELFNNKEKKKLNPLLFVVVTCILALLVIEIIPTDTEKKEAANITKESQNTELATSQNEEREDLESKLKQILGKINGAGDVDVMITFESSEEIVPAFNSSTTTETTKEQDSSGGERTTTNSTQSQTMITSTSNEPVILKTSEAKIKGVIVVASGANNMAVKELLYDAVKTSLQVSGHQVEIYAK